MTAKTLPSIMKKSLERSDVFNLLKKKSAYLEDFVREINIDANSRHEIAVEGNVTTTKRKLEKVLINWINSDTSAVSWLIIIHVLEELKFIELARDVKE